MFHGINESKIRDPKDFPVCAWVISTKPYVGLILGPFQAERELPFTVSQPVLLVTPWPEIHPSSSLLWQPFKLNSLPAVKQHDGLHWGLPRPLAVRVGRDPGGRTCHIYHHCLPSRQPPVCLSSVTHPFHSFICSFIQQIKWTPTYYMPCILLGTENLVVEQNKQNNLTSWSSQSRMRDRH